MDVLNTLGTAGSALTAQRLRMDVISSNLANVETTSTPRGGPYRREMVVFQPRPNPEFDPGQIEAPTMGVEVTAIVQDSRPPRRVHDPENPLADKNGFVSYPNVDLGTEMVDLMAANRAYEANASVIKTTKNVVDRTLELGRA
jgi:flagellar basal-body rod protein FlgC